MSLKNKSKKLDKLYLQFLKDKSKNKIYTNSAKKLIKKIEKYYNNYS
jgi:hypothetical protein